MRSDALGYVGRLHGLPRGCKKQGLATIFINNEFKFKAMIIVQVKEGENIERALKKFKRKFEKTGITKELRARQAFEKPSVTNRKKMMKAVYVQQLRRMEE